MVPFLAVAERAKKRGELAPGQNPYDFVAAVVSPFFYRRWFSREPFDERFVKASLEGSLHKKSANSLTIYLPE